LFHYEICLHLPRNPQAPKTKITELVGKNPTDIKVLYITTPTNIHPEDPPWLEDSIKDLKSQGFQMTRMDIEEKSPEEIRKVVFQHDIVWISGGNTFYFMYWANKKGLKEILMDFLNKGGVYAGESAGVVCQIRDLEPIKWADNPDKAPEVITQGMQLTDVVVLPHWGWEKYAKTMEKIRDYYVERSIKPYLLKDGEALIVKNGIVEEIKN
jgi:dipeptidase E